MENKLLQAEIQSREAWDLIQRHIDLQVDLSGAGRKIHEQICRYYEKDPDAQSIDTDILHHNLEVDLKNNPSKEIILDTLAQFEEVSVSNVIKYILDVKIQGCADEAIKLLAMGKFDQADAWLEKYLNLRSAQSLEEDEEAHEIEVFDHISLDDLLAQHKESGEITLYPPSLDKVVGKVAKGHHIGIFAVPETGKSMFTINLAAGFCYQGLKVLYVGNEDPAPQMIMRFWNRFTNMTKQQIMESPAIAMKIAEEKGYNNLVFVSAAPGTIKDIDGLIAEHKPDVVVVDQARNLNVGKDGLVEILETAAKELRRLAKKWNVLMVSVTQAGDMATGKLVLDRSDIDSSKVGYAAQVDLLLGLGVDDDFNRSNRRMISTLGKNKINGNHTWLSVRVVPELSKVGDL